MLSSGRIFALSMQVRRNFSLKGLNTFGVNVSAKLFCDVVSEDDVSLVIKRDDYQKENKFVLGGGSNILFTKDLAAFCVHNTIKGIAAVREDNEHVLVKAGGGDVWHELVMFCVEREWGGLEN